MGYSQFLEHKTMTDKTSLGDRMKAYEAPSTLRKAFKGQPLIVRLDGKSFHTFTRGLKRPYDKDLSDLMVFLTERLVDRFQARVGYTQSDEITLAWYHQPHESAEYPFDGRFQKLESLTASYAAAVFNVNIEAFLVEKAGQLATFDSRAFVVPTLREAYHAFLWRQQDAVKNAISMAAHTYFSHKSLQGLHGNEMQEKLFQEKGINFNDYPAFFKRGTFVKRHKVLKELSQIELLQIPEQHRPTGPVTRTVLTKFDCWLSREEDPLSILFGDEMPKEPTP
jgi:tRNA(His) 5'-end guanylyltransferase